MRVFVILMFLSIAGTCFAEDPLEDLNTVEDTVSTMEHSLQEQARGRAELSFLAGEELGGRGWVAVTPCSDEPAADRGTSCGSAGSKGPGAAGHIWKSRPAAAAELKPGIMVVARDKGKDGAWVLTRITDVSEIGSGYVAVSAPFRASVKGLWVVEE